MDWESLLYSLPGIIIGLTFHEFCHAFAAYKLGDTTAKDQGRLTFNPLKHIDPIGFIFIIIARFGWAKPVQFNPANLSHYRRDKAIIAAAGPLANFLLATALILLLKGFAALLLDSIMSDNWDRYVFMSSGFFNIMKYILLYAAMINLGLFVFNLLPLPPLDGSHIFFSGLNLRPEIEYRIMKIGMPILFIIIIIQNWAHVTILPINFVVNGILHFMIPEIWILFIMS